MYEKFYSLSEKPFNTTPDSKFFFPSAKHTEALNSLIYAITERKGFVVITGEIGAGKTTVCRTLLNKLDMNTRVALITNTHLTCKELIAEILDEYEIEHKGGTKQKLLSLLNEYLIRQLNSDTNVVLIIDEAQNLTPTVLEEVRMLSNLETEKEKLIQIILMGQPQLKAKLENSRLEQFRQRIAVYYHINALSRQETHDYIVHRLRMVSLNGTNIFTPQALDSVYEHSRGVPRLVNLLCDSALLSGYAYDSKVITDDLIRTVVEERQFHRSAGEQEAPQEPRKEPQNELTQEIPEAPQSTSTKTAELIDIKMFCCSRCQKALNCPIKWENGLKGKEQICCPQCANYTQCKEQALAKIIH